MKFLRFLFSAFCLLSTCQILTAQSVQTQVSNAVLKVYDDELNRNPDNFNVLFRRAFHFYGQNQYNRALADIDRAIQLIPSKDSDLLMQAYSLRANIYLMTDKPQLALPDLDKAYQLDPSSYTLLYQKANTEFLLGNYTAAKDDYKALQRRHNRSLESLIGQARVAVKENNLGLANELVDEAVAMYPSSSEAYTRRASVRRMLGNNVGAVDDLVMAIAVDKDNTKALRDIVKMSHIDYNAVITSLSSAINQAPDNELYTYLRASIAQAHYNYLPALADYQTLIDRHGISHAGVYASMAECYYNLCQFAKALDCINRAIGAGADNAPYYIIRARIHRALGNYNVALESAQLAHQKNPHLNSALIEEAFCDISLEKYNEASNLLGEAALNAPTDPLLPLVRGWLLSGKLHMEVEGKNFLTQAVDLTDYPQSINSLRGFALQAMNDNEQARQWLESALLQTSDIDGRAHYLAACLYAQLGDIDSAFDMMRIALQQGYASLYDWKYSDLANLNVAPLRSDDRFSQLLSTYSHLFE